MVAACLETCSPHRLLMGELQGLAGCAAFRQYRGLSEVTTASSEGRWLFTCLGHCCLVLCFNSTANTFSGSAIRMCKRKYLPRTPIGSLYLQEHLCFWLSGICQWQLCHLNRSRPCHCHFDGRIRNQQASLPELLYTVATQTCSYIRLTCTLMPHRDPCQALLLCHPWWYLQLNCCIQV